MGRAPLGTRIGCPPLGAAMEVEVVPAGGKMSLPHGFQDAWILTEVPVLIERLAVRCGNLRSRLYQCHSTPPIGEIRPGQIIQTIRRTPVSKVTNKKAPYRGLRSQSRGGRLRKRSHPP